MTPQRRTELCGAKTAADIVNSDAVSEHSARECCRALYYCAAKMAARQRYSARGEQSTAQNSTASWRRNISAVAAQLRDELLYASHEILARFTFKI